MPVGETAGAEQPAASGRVFLTNLPRLNHFRPQTLSLTEAMTPVVCQLRIRERQGRHSQHILTNQSANHPSTRTRHTPDFVCGLTFTARTFLPQFSPSIHTTTLHPYRTLPPTKVLHQQYITPRYNEGTLLPLTSIVPCHDKRRYFQARLFRPAPDQPRKESCSSTSKRRGQTDRTPQDDRKHTHKHRDRRLCPAGVSHVAPRVGRRARCCDSRLIRFRIHWIYLVRISDSTLLCKAGSA